MVFRKTYTILTEVAPSMVKLNLSRRWVLGVIAEEGRYNQRELNCAIPHGLSPTDFGTDCRIKRLSVRKGL